MANNLEQPPSVVGLDLDELMAGETAALEANARESLGRGNLEQVPQGPINLRSKAAPLLGTLSEEREKQRKRQTALAKELSDPAEKEGAETEVVDTPLTVRPVHSRKQPSERKVQVDVGEVLETPDELIQEIPIEEIARSNSNSKSNTSSNHGRNPGRNSQKEEPRPPKANTEVESLLRDGSEAVNSRHAEPVLNQPQASPGEQQTGNFFARLRRQTVGVNMTASEVGRWTALPEDLVKKPPKAVSVQGLDVGLNPVDILQKWRANPGQSHLSPAQHELIDGVERLFNSHPKVLERIRKQPPPNLDTRPKERKGHDRRAGQEVVEMEDYFSPEPAKSRHIPQRSRKTKVARVTEPTGVSCGPFAKVLDHGRPPSDVSMTRHSDRRDAFTRNGRERELPQVLRGQTPFVAEPRPLGADDEVQSVFEQHKSASCATMKPPAVRTVRGGGATGGAESLAEMGFLDATRHWLTSDGQRMVPREMPVTGDMQKARSIATKPIKENQRQRVKEITPVVQQERLPKSPASTESRSSTSAETVIRVTQAPKLPATIPLEPSIAANPLPPARFTPGPVNRARLHTFSGDGTEDWSAYAVHVSMVASANCWDAQLTKVMLLTALTGAALHHMRTVPALSTTTLAEVVSILSEEFEKRPVPRMTLISQLNSRVQGPKESYQDLAKSIRTLVLQAYPNLDPAAQVDATCIRFREAIRSKEVRFYVEHLKYYETLQDLVDEAELVSRIHPRSGQTYPPTAAAVHRVSETHSIDGLPVTTGEETPSTSKLEDTIAELVARVGGMESRQKAALKTRTCWNCQKKGHISYDCKEPDRRKESEVKGEKRRRNKKKKDSSSSETDQAETESSTAEKPKHTQSKPKATNAPGKQPGNGK